MVGSSLPRTDFKQKQCDSFIVKLLKKNRGALSKKGDVKELNLGKQVHMLDTLRPLLCLWEKATEARRKNETLGPATVIEAVQWALSLVRNVSFCLIQHHHYSIFSRGLYQGGDEVKDLLTDLQIFVKTDAIKKMVKEVQTEKEMSEALTLIKKKSFFEDSLGKAQANPGCTSPIPTFPTVVLTRHV